MRSLFLAITFIFLSAPLALAQRDTTLVADLPPSGALTVTHDDGNDLGCGLPNSQAGSPIAGLRLDQNEVLCLLVPTGGDGPIELGGVSTARFDPARVGGAPTIFPQGAPAALSVPGAEGLNLHWCGPGRVLTGFNFGNDQLRCEIVRLRTNQAGPAPLSLLRVDGPGPNRPFTQHPYVDRHGRNITMHACSPGWALVGLNKDTNFFLCGLVHAPAAALALSSFDPRHPEAAATGQFTDTFGRAGVAFTDTVRRYFGGVRGLNINCRSSTIKLRDRFGRELPLGAGPDGRGAVAIGGGAVLANGQRVFHWVCASQTMTAFCPSDANVFDVARFDATHLVFRCLRRSPAPWSP